MRLIRYFSIIALVVGIGFCIRQGQPKYQNFSGSIFGTTYHIKIRVFQKDNSLHDKIKAELTLINAQMSVFEKDSEISKINRAPGGRSVVLSDNMGYLLRRAKTIYQQSGGAFDPTVGPLIDAWGFGPGKKLKTPNRRQIQETLRYVGFDKLQFDKLFKTLRKKDGRLSLNLSAIAKGYGVDRVAALLENHGCYDYVVEIGGEIRVSGSRDNAGTPWTVGIREPSENGFNAMAVDMAAGAVATSGDYQNYRVGKDGVRFSHTISPQTGLPVRNELASVTVFSDLCIDADAYATAMMSMGYGKAAAFADKYELAAIFFTHNGSGGFTKSYSALAQQQMGK